LVSPNSPQDVHIRLASSVLPTSTPLEHANINDDFGRASPYIASGDKDVESDGVYEDDLSSIDARMSSIVFNRDPSPRSDPTEEMVARDQDQHLKDEDPRYTG